MSDVNRLVFSIIEFLESQLQLGSLSSDSAESVEVAIQCLETAYGLNTRDESMAPNLRTGRPLLEIFNAAVSTNQEAEASGGASGGTSTPTSESTTKKQKTQLKEITAEDKAKAEDLKIEGNKCMKSESFKEALECYTQAISIDDGNAVYYCNRAAAYSKLGDHPQAIEDCRNALEIDPKYSKAYGRMGLAYTSLQEHEKARDAYKKAIELDPDNASYIANLKIAEQKLRETGPGGGPAGLGGFGGLGGAGGMPDIGALLANPALMNMASTMMQNPEMQRLMQGMLGNTMQATAGAPAAAASSENADPSASMANLLQAGQQLAAQVQQTNPELVDQLRRTMSLQEGNNPSQKEEPEQK
ncbi:small glutamine-rich tetratricopeptide repeat-containing protein beta-like [Ptychodera flava]|uniref:small glutamine-rich tetratricopeptide repeat-containing protein beta-like n=1 Tax=Ptychodera flava TaxID=63121 RepID=UPI00396A22DF